MTDTPTPRPDGIERVALMHGRGDDSVFNLGAGLPLVRLAAAHETFVGAGAVSPGARRHVATVLDDMEREYLTLPVQPRRSEGHEQGPAQIEDAAFTLPGDEREERMWGAPPRHVVELWRGVCPEAPHWLSELWTWGPDGKPMGYGDDPRYDYETAVLEILWWAWNPFTPPEWDIAAAPVLPLAQPLAPVGLVLSNLDGRDMGAWREHRAQNGDPTARWGAKPYDVAWFTGQRPRPDDPRFLPPGEEPDESKRAAHGPHLYEPSDELPGGWVPTFQSVVIVEVTAEALGRIASRASQWPELLGLGLRLTNKAALPELVKALIGRDFVFEAMPASWRFGLVDDATEPMDLGQLIGTASCDRCSAWFWAEDPNGMTKWVDATPDVPGHYEWIGPSLKVASQTCSCCDTDEDGHIIIDDGHDDEGEYQACPFCEEEAVPHEQRPSDHFTQPRLSGLIWEGTGEPPAWLVAQAAEGSVPLLTAAQVPQAHVRGLRLHPRENPQHKDSQCP